MKIIAKLLLVFLLGMPSLLLATESIDINTATADQLMTIKSIGPVKAKRIVEERAGGVFCSLEEFARRVKGIGKKTIETHRDALTVGDVEALCSKKP